MTHGRTIAWFAAALLLVDGRVSGHEPVAAMVEALCARGYYDTAVLYLDNLKDASQLTDEAKKSIPYQQGVVLLNQANGTNDLAVRGKLHDEAVTKFKQFLSDVPGGDFGASATARIASIEVDRARQLAAAAVNGPKAEREKKLVQARKVFERARQQLAAAEKDLTAAIDKMPKFFSAEEESQKQRKLELSAELAESLLTAASVDYEVAKTYPPGGDDAKRHFKAGAEKFSKIYEDYRTRGAGLFAHLWEGKCYQELGDRKRALTAYQDLLDLPAKSQELRIVRARALCNSIEIWCSPEEKKFEAAIEQGEAWLAESDRVPSADPDALAVRYFTAVAYQKQIGTLGTKDSERKQLQQAALKLARAVARQPGEWQGLATKLVAALGGNKEKDPDAPPTDFATARDRGNAALEKMQNARMTREVAAQTQDQNEMTLAEKQEKEGKAEAAHNFKLALALNTGDAKVEDVNAVRCYVCYFQYDAGNYLDAAVLGEYLAIHFPTTAEARQGARFALASWVKQYTGGRPTDDKSFELAKIEQIGSYTLKTWPDQEEAAEAASTLMKLAIQRADMDKLLEYLERIPVNSASRSDAEMRAGQALWTSYLHAARLPDEERPAAEKLEGMKTKAAEILEHGIERMKSSQQVSTNLMAGILSLAQIQVDTGQPEKALASLENDTIGPLKLLKDGNDVVYSSPQMPIEIYKLALRAYVAVEPQRLEDAEKIMNALEKAVSESGDAAASETLTRIYIALGQELQQQLQELRAAKKQKELKAVSSGFESFLSRIIGRDRGNTWGSLTWVAETFYSLGSGFDDPRQLVLSPDAKRYYEKAVKAYQQLIDRAEKEPKFAPNADALVSARLRMALCLRKTGKYDEALKTIIQVLRARPMMLPAQILGAETYQAKGAVDRDSFGIAILGSPEKDKKGQSIIWGWAKLSKMTMNNDKFGDTFHQARLKLSECRFKHGALNNDKEQRTKTLTAARDDLWNTFKLYPKLGGEARTEEYDRLLKQIQKALGEKPLGLEEFRRRAAEAGKAVATGKTTS